MRRRSSARPVLEGLEPNGADTVEIQVSFRHALGFGPGKARLLLAIAETGSISAAAVRMDMSYRRAWELVEELNAGFAQPIVLTQSGGNAGGGAAVTALGFELLRRYREMDLKVQANLEVDLADFSELLAVRMPRAERGS
ncbi:MAG: LysR family transcriptional regulator [Burkholderiales bacterium]|nr:LysR family transcriptional regulator [Burkholderiales bacterium]